MPPDAPAEPPDLPAGEVPFIPDPYVPLPPPPGVPPAPPRATRSGLALSAVLSALLLGPVGAILAVLFGWYGRREIEASGGRRSGHALATLGMVLGLILTPAWGGVLSYLAWTQALHADAARTPEPSGSAGPAVAASPPIAPAAPRAPAPPAPALPAVPPRTTVEREGRITLVELGRATASLSDELARQRAQAGTARETLVVMTTGARCEPCRGVDRALTDPLMQTALAAVRLVRVDGDLFHEDLDALRIPHERIPGFFLLAPDLTPRDGIDGGEWDDDIAANMAPVLGAFVRGRYAERRTRWRPVPGSGVSL